MLDALPDPIPPPDLAARVLADLASARPVRRRARSRTYLLAAAVAAGLLVAVALFLRRAPGEARGPQRVAQVERPVEEAPDVELLESLEVLEDWDLLMSDELDLLLAELDEVDWTLIEAGLAAPAPADEEEDEG